MKEITERETGCTMGRTATVKELSFNTQIDHTSSFTCWRMPQRQIHLILAAVATVIRTAPNGVVVQCHISIN